MPGPLSSLLVTAFAASVVDAAVGADGEVAAGRAPVALAGPEENSLALTVIPGAGLRLRGVSDSLTLSYTPRIFYRIPNELSVDRPLLLHQGSLAHQSSLSRRVGWSNSVQLSVGEVDYTAAGVVFDPRVSSVVRSSVADILRVEGQTGLKLDMTRRLRLALDVSGDYTTPLNESRAIPLDTAAMPAAEGMAPAPTVIIGDAVPESAQVSTQANLSYNVSRYDHLSTGALVTYQWFPDTGRYLLLSPDVSWETQLSERTSLGVSAGFAYVITLEANAGVEDENSFGGTGSFNLSSVVYKSREVNVSSSVNASLDWYFDPLAGTSQPRAGVDLGTNIEIGRDWLINPNAAFYTVLREGRPQVISVDEQGTLTTDVFPDATILRGEIPIRYNLSRAASLSFGARAALRGRAINDEGFSLTEQVEFWAFLGLTVRLATSHDDASWLGF